MIANQIPEVRGVRPCRRLKKNKRIVYNCINERVLVLKFSETHLFIQGKDECGGE